LDGKCLALSNLKKLLGRNILGRSIIPLWFSPFNGSWRRSSFRPSFSSLSDEQSETWPLRRLGPERGVDLHRWRDSWKHEHLSWVLCNLSSLFSLRFGHDRNQQNSEYADGDVSASPISIAVQLQTAQVSVLWPAGLLQVQCNLGSLKVPSRNRIVWITSLTPEFVRKVTIDIIMYMNNNKL
jgi:hypothetical protein